VNGTLFYYGFLALLVGERMLELRISARHARLAFERGGVEVGARHFGVMRALHTAFFAGCALEVWALDRPFLPALALPMLGLALAAQALRWWAVISLGPAWNVRVIVVPGAPLVTRGPYRYLRHPNYLAVVLEGIAVPLIHTAWLTASTFSLANAALLAVRIRSEERALARLGDGAEQLARRPRFLPMRPETQPR
jgi:methyltransferase